MTEANMTQINYSYVKKIAAQIKCLQLGRDCVVVRRVKTHISNSKNVVGVEFPFGRLQQIDSNIRHRLRVPPGSQLADAMMVGNWTARSENFVAGAIFNFLIQVARIIDAEKVKAEVKVNCTTGIIGLSYPGRGDEVLDAIFETFLKILMAFFKNGRKFQNKR